MGAGATYVAFVIPIPPGVVVAVVVDVVADVAADDSCW